MEIQTRRKIKMSKVLKVLGAVTVLGAVAVGVAIAIDPKLKDKMLDTLDDVAAALGCEHGCCHCHCNCDGEPTEDESKDFEDQ